jgi:hypothetical protein
MAVATVNAARQLGTVVGAAALGSVLAAALAGRAGDVPLGEAFLGGVLRGAWLAAAVSAVTAVVAGLSLTARSTAPTGRRGGRRGVRRGGLPPPARGDRRRGRAAAMHSSERVLTGQVLGAEVIAAAAHEVPGDLELHGDHHASAVLLRDLSTPRRGG